MQQEHDKFSSISFLFQRSSVLPCCANLGLCAGSVRDEGVHVDEQTKFRDKVPVLWPAKNY